MTEEENGGAYVSASLGELEVEVQGANVMEVQEVFEQVWQKRLEETEEMSEATKSLRRGYL